MEFTAKEYAKNKNARLACTGIADARVLKERRVDGLTSYGDYGRVIAMLELEDLTPSLDKKRTIPAYLMESHGILTVC